MWAALFKKVWDVDALKCPECGGELTEERTFNLMFKTYVGPVEDETTMAYLRPETAQAIFVDFKQIVDNAKLIFDSRNATGDYGRENDKVEFL